MSDSRHLVRWLCHDLATPIASVLTASELLDDDVADAEINALILSGARRLTARLRLVRLALGAADGAMSGAALGRLVREGLDGTPVDWTITDDAVDGMAALIAGAALITADLNRTKPISVGPAGVTVGGGCNWPDSVAAAFAEAPASCNRSAVAVELVAAAARAGTHLTCSDKGLHWGLHRG